MPFMPCFAQAGPISFSGAIELALHRYEGAVAPPDKSEGAVCPVARQDFAAFAAQVESANETGADASLSGAAASATPLVLQSRNDVILCTALLYLALDDLQRRRQLADRQEQLVTRLMSIESRRVSAEVDHPLQLTQAKMLRARTRLASAALDSAEQTARGGLASLLGVPVEEVAASEDSMPPLPENPPPGENGRVLQRLIAFRDIVQLEYVAEFMNLAKVMHDMALARATIGALVAAETEELTRLSALIQFNDQIRAAKLQFAGGSGNLENWALGRPLTEPLVSTTPSDNAPLIAGTDGKGRADRLLGLLIAPDVRQLPIGKSQQYSAIVTDSEGHARDVTTEAVWSCSSDTKAVMSTTGLLTGLTAGLFTVRVEYQGLVGVRELTIAPRAVDEGSSF